MVADFVRKCYIQRNEIIDTCAVFFPQWSTQALILARSDHCNRLLTTQQFRQQPLLSLQYFGIPDNTMTLDHETVVPIQPPRHRTLVIIQPALRHFVYYDGYGEQPATVVPVISDWLDFLYSTRGIIIATHDNSWPSRGYEMCMNLGRTKRPPGSSSATTSLPKGVYQKLAVAFVIDFQGN